MPVRATPLSADLLLAYAGTALQWRQPIFAWLILVAFDCFLRTGESLSLTPEDITIGSARAVVFIKSSKGAKRLFLPLERLEVSDNVALHALKQLVKTSRANRPFWGSSRRDFMDTWHAISEHLGLSTAHYKPYSLRRGGATSAYKRGETLDALVARGRWQHVHTARIYLDTGLQALATLTLPPTSHHKVRLATQHFLAVSQVGTRGREARDR